MKESAGMLRLVSEYKNLIQQGATVLPDHKNSDPKRVEQLLVTEGEWTPLAAEHLMRLSKDYGSFMLRNALALAISLEIEDGALKF